MSTIMNIEILSEKKKEIFIAEYAGLLHDWQKCIDEKSKVEGIKSGDFSKLLEGSKLPGFIGAKEINLKELCEEGRKPTSAKNHSDWRVKLLGKCHEVAHSDKTLKKKENELLKCDQVSSPFGDEHLKSNNLLGQLINFFDKCTNLDTIERTKLICKVRKVFQKALADDRRPVNEITLWSGSHSTAAFFKSGIARAFLENKEPDTKNIKWRILRVGLNGLDFYSQVSFLPDLLIRQKLFHQALNTVQILLEEKFPLGNEIYRDEMGSAFLVPDLEGEDDEGTRIKSLIENKTVDEFKKSAIGEEILPHLEVSKADKQALTLDCLLKEKTSVHNNIEAVRSLWESSYDICSVCRLRPQGKLQKSLDRKVCDVCEKRREDRSKEWANNLEKTIWIDEVADVNGRIALVVARFEIDDWLKPNGLIKTLLEKSSNSAKENIPKNPSFARLQRIWQTTKQFWEETDSSVKNQVESVPLRLRVTTEDTGKTYPSHAYELKLDNQRLSIVCVKENEFLTVENLCYFAKLLNAEREVYEDHTRSARYIQKRLKEKKEFEIEEPTGYGSRNKSLGRLLIKDVTEESSPYTPAISILAEPRNFMALVPANRALDVITAIKSKYEVEMGKVRNRLPLVVGAVFAGSRTPLSAVLDAGRRMLQIKSEEKKWRVRVEESKKDASFRAEVDNKETSIELNFVDQDEIKITWHVPNKMGDKKTKDDWYPYFFTNKPLGPCPRMFEFDGKRLVHVDDLKTADTVYVQPSYFDFEFLDSAAQRFEISYERGKRRGLRRKSRPYYLEEIDNFNKIWEIISKGLTTSQIKQLEELIETKRSEWGSASKEVLQQFIKDTIYNAEWKKGTFPTKEVDVLVRVAQQGMLTDVIELFMRILKRKSEVDGKE